MFVQLDESDSDVFDRAVLVTLFLYYRLSGSYINDPKRVEMLHDIARFCMVPPFPFENGICPPPPLRYANVNVSLHIFGLCFCPCCICFYLFNFYSIYTSVNLLMKSFPSRQIKSSGDQKAKYAQC
jgi:hypothetical protein